MEAPATHWRAIPLAESRLVAQEPRQVAALDELVREASLQAVAELGAGVVTNDSTWATVIDCRDPRDPRLGHYRGNLPVYPASVIKLCFMVAAYDHNRTRGLPLDDALRRDLDRMIRVSSNEATSRIVDRISNTGFGPSLEDPAAREAFVHKRLETYRLMQQLGLDGLFAFNKTYAGSVRLYGRERDALGQFIGPNFERSNRMTTDDTARLLYLIRRRALIDREASEEMLDLMKRDAQYRSFFTSAIPEGATLYSKGGSTGNNRHDAGIFEFPDGGAIIVVAFTNMPNDQGGHTRVIQRIAQLVLERVAATPGQPDNDTADADPTIGIE